MSNPFVKVVKFSVSQQGIPLVTVHMRYWRAIHSELLTHRVFSRNARSSRAVPVFKMLAEIKNDPFIPRHWGANQKGMQAGAENSERCIVKTAYGLQGIGREILHSLSREEAWLWGRDRAYELAQGYADADYHKQLANRVLEPYSWIDTLVTSTDWANFFALRDHKAAEPHMRDLAMMAKEEIGQREATLLQPGEWHLPYITDEEKMRSRISSKADDRFDGKLRKISAARCARISYAPFDGNSSVEAEIARYDALVTDWPVHASPTEHQATPDTFDDDYPNCYQWACPSLHRNFRGWNQARAYIEHETTWDTAASDKELVG